MPMSHSNNVVPEENTKTSWVLDNARTTEAFARHVKALHARDRIRLLVKAGLLTKKALAKHGR